MAPAAVPYCGPAPIPANLWTSWNFDPFLLAALVGLALAAKLTNPSTRRSDTALGCSLSILAIAFVSPVCALATALFSVRVAHHVLVIAFAAPLLALATPNWALPKRVPLTALVLAQAGFVWIWHAPAPYAWALSGNVAYWLMEISLGLSALWLWQAILRADHNPGAALAALLGTIIQMGLLGALLTFARNPLFDAHAGVTLPFGLTQIEDQQLAGLLMWVPAALPYMIAAAVILFRTLPVAASLRRTGA